MKVLFVLENYVPHIGGVETVFRNLAEGLAGKGHIIDVVTHLIKGTKKFEVINGVKVHRVSCLGSRYFFTFLAVPKAVSLARKADIIHTTTFNGAPPAWLASKLTGKKCVITVHEVWLNQWDKLADMSWLGKRLHNFLERMIYLLPYDYYVCVSNSTRTQLLAIRKGKKNSSVIYNGVDYNHLNPRKYSGKKIRKRFGLQKKFVYLFFGRPGVSKGVEYLIQAVPLISQKIANSKLMLILSRDKAYRKRYNYIISLIKKLKISEKIILLEPRPHKELPNFIKVADCVVLPSLAEGFGYQVIEAAEMQKPIVATNTTSIPEVIYGNYVLIKPKSPEAIATGVELVYKGKTTKAKRKTFTIEANISNYLKVYEGLLKQGRV
jgi:glycosyltransferase involved in cell wall biosynthesis